MNIGEIYIDEYPLEVAKQCNDSQGTDEPCAIKEIAPEEGHRRFQIVSTKLSPEEEEKELKRRRIDELQRYLNSTDWYCARYVDIGIPIPDDIKQQRSEARIEIDRLRHELEPDEPIESQTEQTEPRQEMRPATEAEHQSVNDYIDSISTDTGVDFYDEQEPPNDTDSQ